MSRHWTYFEAETCTPYTLVHNTYLYNQPISTSQPDYHGNT